MNFNFGLSLITLSACLMVFNLVFGFWIEIEHNEIGTLSVLLIAAIMGCAIGHFFQAKKNPSTRTLLVVSYLSCFQLLLSIFAIRYSVYHFKVSLALPLCITFALGLFLGFAQAIELLIPKGFRILEWPAYLVLYTLAVFLPYIFLNFTISNGYQRTSLITGGIYLLITSLFAFFRNRKRHSRTAYFFLLPLLFVPLIFQVAGSFEKMTKELKAGDVKIIKAAHGKQGKIVLTEEKSVGPLSAGLPQNSLYVNGNMKFSSETEQHENECLINVPLLMMGTIKKNPRDILIIGGGDGLAARNSLQFPSVKKITILEPDRTLYQLAKDELKLRMYNLDSLKHPKVETLDKDIFWWINNAPPESFDLLVMDLSTPTDVGLMRLYSAEFFQRLLELLKPGGLVTMRTGSLFKFKNPSHIAESILGLKETWHRLKRNPLFLIPFNQSTGFLVVGKEADLNLQSIWKQVSQLKHGARCQIAITTDSQGHGSYTLNTLHRKSRFTSNLFHRMELNQDFFFLPD